MQKFKISGQHLSEVVLCLAAVGAAILTMRLYLLRSIQARQKAGTDYVFSQIEQEAVRKNQPHLQNIERQYDPYYREAYTTENRESDSTGGFPDTSVNQTITRSGVEMINAP